MMVEISKEMTVTPFCHIIHFADEEAELMKIFKKSKIMQILSNKMESRVKASKICDNSAASSEL